MKLVGIVLLFLFSFALADNWVFLIAGSRTYSNYRHQSDICHAYHLVTAKGGIPADHVITMMYDDAARASQNPFKNNLINKPNGPNYYPETKINYKEEDCTASNFLAILSGDKSKVSGGDGSVIDSNENDNVFVYYADHGGVGLVAMPVGGYLYANDLLDTLKKMYTAKKYKNLVFYMEACESGSMFTDLPDNIDIFATTAANASQSSYAWYYDASRGTYLGDEYSVKWMEDSDVVPFATTTLGKQYQTLKETVTKSHCCQWGDNGMEDMPIGDFQGKKGTSEEKNTIEGEGIDSRDVKLEYYRRRLEASNSEEERQEYAALYDGELKSRLFWDNTIESIVRSVAGERFSTVFHDKARLRDYTCHRASVESVEKYCGQFTEYSLKYVQNLVNMCEGGYSIDAIANAAKLICH